MPQITVYSLPNCQPCRATYRKLDKHGLEYTVVDVSQDADALAYVRSLGYLESPVVVAGDQTWHGYRPTLIEALAAKHASS